MEHICEGHHVEACVLTCKFIGIQERFCKNTMMYTKGKCKGCRRARHLFSILGRILYIQYFVCYTMYDGVGNTTPKYSFKWNTILKIHSGPISDVKKEESPMLCLLSFVNIAFCCSILPSRNFIVSKVMDLLCLLALWELKAEEI